MEKSEVSQRFVKKNWQVSTLQQYSQNYPPFLSFAPISPPSHLREIKSEMLN
jgi:hypothetical protein